MTLFDRLAYPYTWFYKHQVRQAKRSIPILLETLAEPCLSVLDVGCGTGAMCQVFYENKISVDGCDRSAEMLKYAKRLTSAEITYTRADTQIGLPYGDGSFDLVYASLVAHGMPADQRRMLYTEMRRISRKYVVLLEYSQTRHWLVDIMEFLERGDYFNFIKVVDKELNSYFGDLKKIPVNRFAALYIMKSNDSD
jgi:ubiquinone/menaquinone biosynthesis C-methylase UbiE